MQTTMNLYQQVGTVTLSPATAMLQLDLIGVDEKIFRRLGLVSYGQVSLLKVSAEQTGEYPIRATLLTTDHDFVDRVYIAIGINKSASVIAWGFRYFLWEPEVEAWTEALCGSALRTKNAIAESSDRASGVKE